jgi:hypothetical protein
MFKEAGFLLSVAPWRLAFRAFARKADRPSLLLQRARAAPSERERDIDGYK